MIDIHTHILPSVDDGASSFRESVQMAQMAVNSGVKGIVVTPHSNIKGLYENYYDTPMEESFQKLKEIFLKEKIPLNLYLGMEVYATEEVPKLLRQGKLITINYSRYLLMEFGFDEDLSLVDFLLNEIISLGITPIIAHPERYPYIQRSPDRTLEWIMLGCYLQLNKGSIFGRYGSSAKHTSHYLLQNNWAAFIASDAHSQNIRTTDMSETYRYVSYYFSKEYAKILMMENPMRAIENQSLIRRY